MAGSVASLYNAGMKPIEIVFLIASFVLGLFVLITIVSLIRKAEREKREFEATREKSEP